jgi:hypothetical protein
MINPRRPFMGKQGTANGRAVMPKHILVVEDDDGLRYT